MSTRNETVWCCDGEGCDQEETRLVNARPEGWSILSIDYTTEDGEKRLRILHLCRTCSPKALALGEAFDVPNEPKPTTHKSSALM